MNLLILVITLVGLALLLVALYKAAPVVDFGTRKDNEVKREGRDAMPLAVAVVLVAAILLASRGRWGVGLLVALPALIPAALLVVLDEDYAVLAALDRPGRRHALQRALDAAGQSLRPSANTEPFKPERQPWLDLQRVTVKVRSGLLCVTIRRVATAPKDAAANYALRIAPSSGPAGSNVLLIGHGVQWLPDGNAQSDEAQVPHAYRERGSTINVAIDVDRLDTPYPLAFDRFRWKMRSASRFMFKGRRMYATVDCAPQDGWVSYPQSRRTDQPEDNVKDRRCPAP